MPFLPVELERLGERRFILAGRHVERGRDVEQGVSLEHRGVRPPRELDGFAREDSCLVSTTGGGGEACSDRVKYGLRLDIIVSSKLRGDVRDLFCLIEAAELDQRLGKKRRDIRQ